MTDPAIAARLNARLGLQLERDNPREEVGKFERPAVVSHRYTTSSRTPGVVKTRPVVTRPSQLVVCRSCKGKMDSAVPQGRHSLHFAQVEGELRLVDCAGLVLA